MTEITCVGVLAHPLRVQTHPIAHEIQARLQARGLESYVYTDWKEGDVAADCLDMVIAIGGDGAMLRAARVCAPYEVAVLGINMGNLGFLTEISDPHNWEPSLNAVLAGDYWVEKRMMIHAAVLRGGEVIAEGEALNDIVISGEVVGHMIQLDTFIDNDWATTYFADALVIATPTGSTAYALACGGPILPPELNNILIVPAAPHLSMSRPIILSEGAKVDVNASSNTHTHVVVTADGAQLCHVEPNDRVHVEVSNHESRFIRLREQNYFYRSLLDRLEPRVQRNSTGEKRLK